MSTKEAWIFFGGRIGVTKKFEDTNVKFQQGSKFNEKIEMRDFRALSTLLPNVKNQRKRTLV